MPRSLRFKLWLGRFFGWDKDGLRIVLFVAAMLVAGFTYDAVVRPVIFPEPAEWSAQEEKDARERLNELLKERSLPTLEP